MAELRERLGELGERRDAVAAARDRAVALELEWGRARDAGAPDADELRDALAATRAEHAMLAAELEAALIQAHAEMSLDEVLAVLDPAVPLVLLPVGIETRFTYVDGQPDELLVRVLPDEVHVQSHEPELTEGELRQGRDYWTAFFRAGRDPAREASAWAMLARGLGEARATWVRTQLTPENLDERPGEPVDDDHAPDPAPAIVDPGQLRRGGWTRAAVAGTLPDRWLAVGWQGSSPVPTFVAPGRIVPDELQVGPSPYHPTDEPPAGSIVEEGMRWVVDFNEAERVGMAIRIKLAEVGVSLGVTPPLLRRLAVVGVSASLDVERSSQRLAALVEDHVHTEGFGFLPIGTPTNNSATDPTAWTARAGADARTPVTVDPAVMHPQANAPLAAHALGLDRAQLADVPHADGRDQVDADAMQTLLWSATGGYFIEHLWRDAQTPKDLFSAESRAFLHHHFTDRVRARGPLPTLRVGAQPYGLLPVTATSRWNPHPSEEAPMTSLVSVMRAALVLWKRAVGRVPSVTNRDDPDVLKALGIAAVSQSVHVRAVSGGHRLSMTHEIPLSPGDPRTPVIRNSAQVMVDTILAMANIPSPGFPLLYAAAEDRRLWLPLAQPGGDTKQQVDAVAGFLERVMDDRLFIMTLLEDDPDTLLAVLARYAATLEIQLAAEEHDEIKRRGGIVHAEINLERLAQVAPPGIELAHTAISALQVELVSGGTVGSELIGLATSRVVDILARASATPLRQVAAELFIGRPASARSAAVAASAAHLGARLREQDAAGEDAFAALERLVGESLDLWSHRLDAWVTSVATRRLEALRADRGDGVQLGGYGYVDNLSPSGPPVVERTDAEGALLRPAHADGSLLAPSLDQAVTAAILRSGQLTHRADSALDVDLSSERARIASEIVEGVRVGQPLGALIGYRIERRLHDRAGEPNMAILNAVIADLRRIAGLPGGVLSPPQQSPAEAISANSVIDGLRLLRHDEEPIETRVDAVVDNVPGLGALQQKALREVLMQSAVDIDAVADLLLAESVFQLTTGRADRAAATLDALAGRGALPGEPEVLRTPRRGTSITLRVLLAAPADATAQTWGWPTDGARAEAEPRLDAWAASVLGDPGRVRFEVAELGAGEHLAELADDRWSAASLPAGAGAPGALDVIALAAASGELLAAPIEVASSPLLLSITPGAGAVRPHPTLASGDDITLLELAAVARSAATVLAVARDPEPAELGADVASTTPAGWSFEAIEELRSRVVGARGRLADLVDRLEAAPSDAATIAAAMRFGIAGAGAAAALADGDAATARLTHDTASARLLEADALLAAPAAPLSDGAQVTRLVDALQFIFGPGFRAVPVDRPPHTDDLIESSEDFFGDGSRSPRVRDWLDRSATARPGCAALADVLLHVEALPPASGELRGPSLLAAQAPFRSSDGWLGESDPPPRIATDPRQVPIAFAMHGALPDAGEAVALLVVDEWNEVVPAADATAGLAFSYDAPGARPPQAILLAVHPTPGAAWDVGTLTALVDETADLAQVRMVDLEAIDLLGAILPALYSSQDVIGKVPKLSLDLVSERLFSAGALEGVVKHIADREA